MSIIVFAGNQMRVYLQPPQPSRGLDRCEWKRIAGNENSGMYVVSCGEVRILDGIPENDQPCPYCGKLIIVTVERHS